MIFSWVDAEEVGRQAVGLARDIRGEEGLSSPQAPRYWRPMSKSRDSFRQSGAQVSSCGYMDKGWWFASSRSATAGLAKGFQWRSNALFCA